MSDQNLTPMEARRHWVLLGLLVLAVCLCYSNSLKGEFVYDDVGDILANPSIRHLWPLGPLFKAKVGDHWCWLTRPIPNLTFALNHALGGLNPVGFHVFNALVHLGSVLTLFSFARKAWGGITGAYLGFFLALVWGIHPLQTESVSYITQRYESVMGCFVLLCFYGFQKGALAPTRWKWHLVALVSLLFALLSKEVAAGTPLLVLLYDRAFHSGGFREAWRRHRFFYLGALLCWAVFLAVQLQVKGRESWAGPGLGVSPWQYAQAQPGVILHYLRLVVFPHPLIFDHFWPDPARWTQWVPQTIAILGLLGASFWLLFRHPHLGFLAAAFWVFLAPSSSIVPILDRAVEHRMYLSLAPALALLLVGGDWVLARSQALERRMPRLLVVVGVALALGALGIKTYLRNEDYRNAISLWLATSQDAPHNGRALLNLGVALEEKGFIREAEAAYRKSYEVMPAALPAHNLGTMLLREGSSECVAYFQKALELSPHEPVFATSLAMGYLATQQKEKAWAIAHEWALRRNLWEGDCRRLAGVMQRLGCMEDAERLLHRALEFDSRSSGSLFDLGGHLLKVHRQAEAQAVFEQAIKWAPDPREAHLKHAFLLQVHGLDHQAIQAYDRALALDPMDRKAMAGKALLRASSAQDGVRSGGEAVRLSELMLAADKVRDPELLEIYAMALAETGRFPDAIRIQKEAMASPAMPRFAKPVAEDRLQVYMAGKAYRLPPARPWYAFEPAGRV